MYAPTGITQPIAIAAAASQPLRCFQPWVIQPRMSRNSGKMTSTIAPSVLTSTA